MRHTLAVLVASLVAVTAVAAPAKTPAPAPAAAKTKTLPSGVTVTKLTTTTGASPKATDTVRVHYRGTLAVDGQEFDSSYKRGQPLSFPLSQVIPCWTQGMQELHVGEKAVLECPADTAYGAAGVPGHIPPNSKLKFEVELLGIQ